MIASVDDLIQFHEGFAPIAKPDAKGKWAFGFGFDIDPPAPGTEPPTISRDEALAQFPTYRDKAVAGALGDLGAADWANLDPVRQAVLIDMAYELGGAGLAAFIKFLAAVRRHDWTTARVELIASRLYDQVPTREAMNCQILASGQWPAA